MRSKIPLVFITSGAVTAIQLCCMTFCMAIYPLNFMVTRVKVMGLKPLTPQVLATCFSQLDYRISFAHMSVNTKSITFALVFLAAHLTLVFTYKALLIFFFFAGLHDLRSGFLEYFFIHLPLDLHLLWLSEKEGR